MADYISLSEEEQEPELQKKNDREFNQGDKDAELVFVGMEHVNKDAEILFVRMISNSKPVISKILNRVTPGSHSKRKKSYPSQDPAHMSQPASHVTPVAKAKAVMPASQLEWRPTDSPITTESSSKPVHETRSPQVNSPNPSDLFAQSIHSLGGAPLPVGDGDEDPSDSKCPSTSHTKSTSPKRSKLRNEVPSAHPPDTTSSGVSSTVEPSTPSKSICLSSCVQNGKSILGASVNEEAPFALRSPHPVNSFEGLVETGLSNQSKTFDLQKENLILLLSDFYYGQHKGDGPSEPKTYTTFKCLSCLKVLKNIKFMNHMKHHLELEKQRADSWENHTTCQHCHRQFPTPFQLQCHIDSVHTTQEPSAVCKICELSFETDQVLLQHMKDNHKAGEMPYVCQVCNYRSSAFADVEAHFRTAHENTKDLLCLFCLKVFKTANPYMSHCWRHWSKKKVFPCPKCRLQFLSSKEEMDHKTKNHQTFKKPVPLEGLPPETKVVIQTSVHPPRGLASVIVSNTDPCLSPVKTRKRKTMDPACCTFPCSHSSG